MPRALVTRLQRQFDYHYWATHKLLGAIRAVPTDVYDRSIAGSYESIRNTLVHVLSAEWGWLDRCGGEPRGEKLAPERYPTPDDLLSQWNRVEGWMRSFLQDLDDSALERRVEFSFGQSPARSVSVEHILEHCLFHAAHHRGQVALLMRMAGHAPGNFDRVFFDG